MKRCVNCGRDLIEHTPDGIVICAAMVAAFGPNGMLVLEEIEKVEVIP